MKLNSKPSKDAQKLIEISQKQSTKPLKSAVNDIDNAVDKKICDEIDELNRVQVKKKLFCCILNIIFLN